MTQPLVRMPSRGRKRKKEDAKPPEVRRTRPRPQSPNISGRENEIVNRVKDFYANDQMARRADMGARIQREAKMRMWIDEGYSGPWPDSSNIALGDIMAVVLRSEDTLQNAILSTRPVVTSKSVQSKDKERESKVDQLHDYQFFVEQNGENLVEMLSCDFVRDGSYKAYTRWVMEHRRSIQTRHFSAIPSLARPRDHFEGIIKQHIEDAKEWSEIPDSDGWDWKVRQGQTWLEVRFYTDAEKDDEVIAEISADLKVYEGPCTIRYSYEDVLYPYFCENLQSPGPSNPRGAGHVILVDYPTLDEIKRLVRNGEYDLVSMSDIEGLQPQTIPNQREHDLSIEQSKDEMRGFDTDSSRFSSLARSHGSVCRLTCFDLWEPSDGQESIDVVWTVLKDHDLLVRAKHLGEVAPGNPPRRPLASAAMIPIPGRVDGIGLPELMEALHDFKKTTFDMMVDSAHIEMIPWFTYRQSSMINPESYRIFPGAGMPVGQRGDIEMQQVRPQATANGLNLIALADQQQDDLTMIGELQLGRIPAGKSSALRTSGGIQQVLAQGEARPERVLRRFFSGFKCIFEHMWALNQHFLPEEKQFRVLGVLDDEESLVSITRKQDLSAGMAFDFQANILNSSKIAMQQAMETVLTMVLNPLTLQMGVADGDSIYRVMHDYLRSLGQNPEKYLNRPTPESSEPRIMADEAMSWIIRGQLPVGVPAEGSAQAHLEGLTEILQRPSSTGEGTFADALDPGDLQVLRQYVQQVQQRVVQESQAAQQQQAAAQLQTQMTQQGGRGATGSQAQGSGPPMVQQNDVIDESLPGSGTPQ